MRGRPHRPAYAEAHGLRRSRSSNEHKTPHKEGHHKGAKVRNDAAAVQALKPPHQQWRKLFVYVVSTWSTYMQQPSLPFLAFGQLPAPSRMGIQ